ncbi:hypothetical protein [Kangiella sp. HZ709]|uniref:CC0125/CC1285 family lipoprotein n=1 Tax=Kangiella sp. HZ709 TaxID=2666328 RepID=UPI0012B07B3A|nr:hypothetical protein [Kangiella sp. HZ709]MRX27367.1 hypothetical protein [Kangiella sp. HZ709]
MKKIIIIFIFLLLNGCATPYQSSGLFSWSGGFDETPGPGKLTKVYFSGNGFIEHETAKIYALYRSAEYTKEQGKSFFQMYTSLINASKDITSDTVMLGSVGGKPTAFAYVLLLENPNENSLNADEVIEKYNHIVNPPKKEKNKRGKS